MKEEADRIEGLSRLARRRAPERDLWPGIAARLPRRRSRYPFVQLALAASLVAGLAGVFSLQVARLPSAGSSLAGTQVVASLDQPMTTDSRAIVKANIAMVRQAEREVRKALEQDPDSTSLRTLLASAQNQQRALRALL
jgi:hypothetical protein